MEIKKPDLKPLSASKIKTLENCSWLYHCNYSLKIPQPQNDGSRKGSICHTIFELLLTKKHYDKFQNIVSAKTVTAEPSVARLIKKHAKQLELTPSQENLLQIDKMILVGLNADFFIKGATLISPEYEFNILNENPKYHIRGFMDKPFEKKKMVIIDDFKSSKKKFEGEDQESNIQAMIYSLAATKLWPDKKPIIRFIFLQYPEDPIMELEFSKDSLKGFEEYLAKIQARVDSFSEENARQEFAYDKGLPKTGEFKGKLLCGFAKTPDQKKKDGTKMWACPYKFAFHYWVIEKDKKFVSSSLEEPKALKSGETVEKRHYDGCPKFKYGNILNNFAKKDVSEEVKPKKYGNVLDKLFKK